MSSSIGVEVLVDLKCASKILVLCSDDKTIPLGYNATGNYNIGKKFEVYLSTYMMIEAWSIGLQLFQNYVKSGLTQEKLWPIMT